MSKSQTKKIAISGAYLAKPIPTGYARQLAKNYKENKLYPGDAQGVWYDKAIFKSMVDDENITGFRFYFGAYGKKEDYPAFGKKDKLPPFEKTTIIIVPTSKNKILDSGGDEVKGSDGNSIYMDILTNKKAAPCYPGKCEAESSKFFEEQNDGQFCPPPPLGGNSTSDDLLNGI